MKSKTEASMEDSEASTDLNNTGNNFSSNQSQT